MSSRYVLKTVYLDPDVDEWIRREAIQSNMSKAAVFRRCLAAGIKVAKSQPGLRNALSVEPNSRPLILRTIDVDAKLDDRLRVVAFDSRVDKNDLIREYLKLAIGQRPSPGTSKP